MGEAINLSSNAFLNAFIRKYFMQRLVSIDIAKAICIILVVIGHYHPGNAPEWYIFINRFIYSFHMPVFMFASGYIYIATLKKESYIHFITKKIKRLMLPYITTSFLIISLKLLTQGNAYVENPVTAISYLKIFYLPEAGFFLWFIWALWWMFVILPLFKTKKVRGWLFLVSILIAYIPISLPEIFCFRQFKNMLMYFMLGVFIYENKEIVKIKFAGRYLPFLIFGVLEFLYLSDAINGGLAIIYKLIPFAGIWAIIQFSNYISKSINNSKQSWLLSIATSSYIIYLFHTTFEGFTKALCQKIPLDSNLWYIFTLEALIVIIVGIVGPILLHHYILQRNTITKYIFGLK